MSTKSSTHKAPSIVMPSAEEDEKIRAAAASDPDAQPLTDEQLSSLLPLRRLRGRPKSGRTKQLVSIRYSPEVIEYFKRTGKGWQARMDHVLKEFVAQQSNDS